MHHALKQVLVKPLHSLVESLLLGESHNLVVDITTDSETVRNAGEQVDLEGLARLDEDLLGSVAELGGENTVGLRGGDGERAADGGKLVLLDERGVGDVADVDALLIVANNVLILS